MELPDDCWSTIFEKLPKRQMVHSVSLVCKRWNFIFRSQVTKIKLKSAKDAKHLNLDPLVNTLFPAVNEVWYSDFVEPSISPLRCLADQLTSVTIRCLNEQTFAILTEFPSTLTSIVLKGISPNMKKIKPAVLGLLKRCAGSLTSLKLSLTQQGSDYFGTNSDIGAVTLPKLKHLHLRALNAKFVCPVLEAVSIRDAKESSDSIREEISVHYFKKCPLLRTYYGDHIEQAPTYLTKIATTAAFDEEFLNAHPQLVEVDRDLSAPFPVSPLPPGRLRKLHSYVIDDMSEDLKNQISDYGIVFDLDPDEGQVYDLMLPDAEVLTKMSVRLEIEDIASETIDMFPFKGLTVSITDYPNITRFEITVSKRNETDRARRSKTKSNLYMALLQGCPLLTELIMPFFPPYPQQLLEEGAKFENLKTYTVELNVWPAYEDAIAMSQLCPNLTSLTVKARDHDGFQTVGKFLVYLVDNWETAAPKLEWLDVDDYAEEAEVFEDNSVCGPVYCKLLQSRPLLQLPLYTETRSTCTPEEQQQFEARFPDKHALEELRHCAITDRYYYRDLTLFFESPIGVRLLKGYETARDKLLNEEYGEVPSGDEVSSDDEEEEEEEEEEEDGEEEEEGEDDNSE